MPSALYISCADTESFFLSNFDNVFFLVLVDEGIQKPLKAGHQRQPAKHRFNGISLACQWWHNTECWVGSFVIIQEIWTSIA